MLTCTCVYVGTRQLSQVWQHSIKLPASLIEKWKASAAQRYWDDFRTKTSLLQSAERVAKLMALGMPWEIAWRASTDSW